MEKAGGVVPPLPWWGGASKGHPSFAVGNSGLWEDAQVMTHATATLLDISQLRGLVPTQSTEQPVYSLEFEEKGRRTSKKMQVKIVKRGFY